MLIRGLVVMLGAAGIAAAALALRAKHTPNDTAPIPGSDAGRDAAPKPLTKAGLDPDLFGDEEPNGCLRLAETAGPFPGDPPLRRCRPKCSAAFVEERDGYECVHCELRPVYDGPRDAAGQIPVACQQRFDASWTHKCDHLLTKGMPYELWCRQRTPE
jgi:hypothetical protein